MKSNTVRLATIALGVAMAASSMASLTTYSQNFETLNATAPDALSLNGWLVYGNVFDSQGNYVYGYGSFPAPNGTPGFCAIATGEAGAEQGTQYINTYSDYNNGDHANNRFIEANIFQEQVVGIGDLGKTYRFDFDYKASSQVPPSGQTTARAFIKVLDPSSGYAIVAFPNFLTTSASTTAWGTNSLSVTIGAGWTGHLLQFGFTSTATQYQPSGVFYDNLRFAPLSVLSGTISFNDFVGSQAGRNVSIVVTAVGSMTPLFSGTTALNVAGEYSINVPGLAAGSYDLYIDGTPFLKKKRSLTWTASGASAVNAALVNGDCDNSGEVDAVDIDLVIAAFGAVVGDGNYSVSVDVDGSGEVDAVDIDIVIANFGAIDN